jgi:hypothetical protein
MILISLNPQDIHYIDELFLNNLIKILFRIFLQIDDNQ